MAFGTTPRHIQEVTCENLKHKKIIHNEILTADSDHSDNQFSKT